MKIIKVVANSINKIIMWVWHFQNRLKKIIHYLKWKVGYSKEKVAIKSFNN